MKKNRNHYERNKLEFFSKITRVTKIIVILCAVTVSQLWAGSHERSSIPEAGNQQQSISGKVTDKTGMPVPGVSVSVKGTTRGTLTDGNGNYSLSLTPDVKVLTFSFVGMKSQEISVSGKSSVNIIMIEETVALEEVVAVGYGTQKKRDVIGSIATIKSKSLQATTNQTNVLSLLQGQAAGVSVQSTSGRLGAGVNILVRGLSSISAETTPLYIIDGVPVIGDMSLINQADIESIQVLKDAAATSI